MANPISATRDYFRHSVAELQKVTWPTRELTIRYSALVVAVSIVLAAFFAALDFGLSQGVTFGLAHQAAAPAGTVPATPAPNVTPTVDTSSQDPQVIHVTNDEAKPNQPPAQPSGDKSITLPPINASAQ